ncbi:malonic semialdehyde reductase [Pelagibacterium lacus]|uniref:Putative NADH dehydrogenase/NAD(P)H nitroreductase DVH29_14705 n=1 Tax=Pelagibacterium lacus TaxID=2282655 RepID=A0A369VZK5_9HYPH|nr:malonic semialdehyde reductase [Pelagibacterium lacus]RDE07826.1 malonic semialdehyde reductase [Pelagibacterium lacus]
MRSDNQGVDERCRQVLFTRARSHNRWTDHPVEEDVLRRIYEIAIWGPTSTNQQPARIIFVRSPAARERLLPAVTESNRPKIMQAPVTAIFGYDLRFFEKLPALFPHRPEAAQDFMVDGVHAERSAFRNATLQAAYFMLAARAVGLDIGPLSGFDHDAVDTTFFAGTTVRSNFLCCLGYADSEGIYRRLPRLTFDEAASFA